MKKETQVAVGVVAGLVILAAGWLWLDREEGGELLDIPEIAELEQPPVPAYEEYSDPDEGKDSNIDDLSGDVTRIIIRDPVRPDDIDLDEVLAGKVIIDGQVVRQPGNK